jgi:hypothetical protein
MVNMNRIQRAWYMVAVLFINGLVAEALPSVKSLSLGYKEIGNLYLPSLGLSDSRDNEVIDKDAPVNFELVALSARDKREIVYNLLSQTNAQDPAIATLLKDLEVFVGQGKNAQAHIFNTINNTKTIFGEVVLSSILANPITDIDVLNRRQMLVRELVENERLFQAVDSLVEKIKNAEEGFLSFWKDETGPNNDFIQKRLYFNKERLKSFNTNPYVMEANARLGNFGTAYMISTIPGIMFGMTYGMGKLNVMALEKAKAQGFPVPPNMPTTYNLKDACIDFGKTVKDSINPYAYKNKYDLLIEAYEKAQFNPSVAKKISVGVISATAAWSLYNWISWLYTTKRAVSDANTVKTAINYLHTRLIDVASVVNAAKDMREMTELHTVLRNGLIHGDAIHELFETGDSKTSFDSLVSLLQKNTFKGDASFFALSGRVLAAFELMKQSKNEFAECIEALGELDALLSIAKLYKKMSHADVSYSFAEYISAQQPIVNAQGFWHPLIAVEKVVPNDIMLGDADHNVILTGSNTGGKSTILKSMMLSILFAQTLTVAPVQSITLTPFAYIGSYLHIQDDVAEGHSLFKKEVLSAQSLIEKTQRLQNNEFGFVVMDELFTGTASEKGAHAAYKVAERLAQNPNLLYVLATHFPLLTTLENTGACTNYKVDVIKQDDGTIIRPFKLEKGISTTSIADDILHAEISDIDFSL